MTAILPPHANFIATTMTPEEYDKLPPNPRVELVDGVVHVMALATRLHQEVVDALKIALSRLRPSDLIVVREQELKLRDEATSVRATPWSHLGWPGRKYRYPTSSREVAGEFEVGLG